MSDTERDPVPEAPATWENVVVGKAEELLGRAVNDEQMEEEGEERSKIAHEVREEYHEEREQ